MTTIEQSVITILTSKAGKGGSAFHICCLLGKEYTRTQISGALQRLKKAGKVTNAGYSAYWQLTEPNHD